MSLDSSYYSSKGVATAVWLCDYRTGNSFWVVPIIETGGCFWIIPTDFEMMSSKRWQTQEPNIRQQLQAPACSSIVMFWPWEQCFRLQLPQSSSPFSFSIKTVLRTRRNASLALDILDNSSKPSIPCFAHSSNFGDCSVVQTDLILSQTQLSSRLYCFQTIIFSTKSKHFRPISWIAHFRISTICHLSERRKIASHLSVYPKQLNTLENLR
jgi:hypothetical protein